MNLELLYKGFNILKESDLVIKFNQWIKYNECLCSSATLSYERGFHFWLNSGGRLYLHYYTSSVYIEEVLSYPVVKVLSFKLIEEYQDKRPTWSF